MQFMRLLAGANDIQLNQLLVEHHVVCIVASVICLTCNEQFDELVKVYIATGLSATGQEATVPSTTNTEHVPNLKRRGDILTASLVDFAGSIARNDALHNSWMAKFTSS